MVLCGERFDGSHVRDTFFSHSRGSCSKIIKLPFIWEVFFEVFHPSTIEKRKSEKRQQATKSYGTQFPGNDEHVYELGNDENEGSEDHLEIVTEPHLDGSNIRIDSTKQVPCPLLVEKLDIFFYDWFIQVFSDIKNYAFSE